MNVGTQGRPVSDAGRRLADAATLARSLGGVGRWIAARLSDGGTDGSVYDTKADAISHQLHETQCAYLMIPPGPMSPEDATGWLDLHRRAYDAGMRLADPDGATPVMSLLQPNRADRRAALRRNR